MPIVSTIVMPRLSPTVMPMVMPIMDPVVMPVIGLIAMPVPVARPIRCGRRRMIRFRSYSGIAGEEASKSHMIQLRADLALDATDRCDMQPPFAPDGSSRASEIRARRYRGRRRVGR